MNPERPEGAEIASTTARRRTGRCHVWVVDGLDVNTVDEIGLFRCLGEEYFSTCDISHIGNRKQSLNKKLQYVNDRQLGEQKHRKNSFCIGRKNAGDTNTTNSCSLTKKDLVSQEKVQSNVRIRANIHRIFELNNIVIIYSIT